MKAKTTYVHEPHGDKLEALLLEPLQDLSDEPSLHAIGLDHDEGSLLVSFGGHFEVRVVAVSRNGNYKAAVNWMPERKMAKWKLTELPSCPSCVIPPVGTPKSYILKQESCTI